MSVRPQAQPQLPACPLHAMLHLTKHNCQRLCSVKQQELYLGGQATILFEAGHQDAGACPVLGVILEACLHFASKEGV